MSDEKEAEVTETKETTESAVEETKTTEDVIVERDESIKAVDAILNPQESEKEAEVKEKEDAGEESKSEVEAEVKPDPEKEADTEATNKVDEQVQNLNLPSRLLQAAKRNHISNQEILDYGDKAEKILTHFADSSDRISAELGAVGRKVKSAALTNPKKEVKQTTLNLDESEDDLEEIRVLKKAVNALTTEISGLKEQVSAKSVESTQAADLERDKKIDAYFDSRANDFSEFGNSSNLTQAELTMRKTTWELADDILIGANVSGQKMSLEEALDAALSVYENKNPQKKKVTREQVLKEVETREKSLMQRPTSKKKAATTGTKDQRKDAIKAVSDVLNKGRDGW